MSREADFRQLERFFGNFIDAYADFDDFLRRFLLREANRALADITERHNQIYAATGKTVDTSAMRDTWFVGDVSVSGNNLEVVLGNPQNYASFIEFGARNVDGSWREGYFIMTIPIDRIQQQLPARFERDFVQYMKSKGTG